jgi:hypothetical protein
MSLASAQFPRIRFMIGNHRARYAAAAVLIAGLSTFSCTAGGEDTSALASCEEIVPPKIVADILGDESGRLVRLRVDEPDSVSPLVGQMVRDGIACGGSADGKPTLDGAVMLGQLPMDESQWNEIKEGLAADGHAAIEFAGISEWVDVTRTGDGPLGGGGFAWKDKVLYYAMNPVLLTFVPAFAQ